MTARERHFFICRSKDCSDAKVFGRCTVSIGIANLPVELHANGLNNAKICLKYPNMAREGMSRPNWVYSPQKPSNKKSEKAGGVDNGHALSDESFLEVI